MGIDIYAEWRGQSDGERQAQSAAGFSVTSGNVGYLREAYHGEPYATKFLCGEAFETGRASIPAATLAERLPRTLAIAEQRERKLYKATDSEVEEVKQSYRDFVALCETMERKTGEPVSIVASY